MVAREKPKFRDTCDGCGHLLDTPGPNRAAAELTVKALRSSGQLEDADEALVEAVLSLASSCDSAEAGGDLWREYRQHAQALREVAAGGSDDDTAEFLVSIQTPRAAKVRDRKKL